MWTRHAQAIPTAEPERFRVAARRTRIVRLVLGGLLAALVGASIAFAHDLRVRQSAFFPRGTSGVVVLDLSTSIDAGSYRRIGSVFDQLIASDPPIGLVIFSDVAYELFPPGTPARELKQFVRFFTPRGSRFPTNPWATTFRGGTRISDGLALAREMLRTRRVEHGSILLVSDLETASSDVGALTKILFDLRNSSIPLRVVGLAALRDDAFFFQSILGKQAFVEPLAPSQAARVRREARAQGSQPRWLVIAGAVLAVLLAANERWCGRLVLPRRVAA